MTKSDSLKVRLLGMQREALGMEASARFFLFETIPNQVSTFVNLPSLLGGFA
jgi:hypothetical protein